MHVFLRHPPLPAMQGLCYGRLDSPLDARVFNDAAARLAAALPAWPIVSSPSARCLQLAQALQRETAGRNAGTRRLVVDERLRELDFGDWEGRPWDALPRESLDAWSRDIAGFAPPGGESFRQLIARARQALAALDAPHIVVTHAGVVRAAWHLAGHPCEEAARIEVPHLQPIRVAVVATQG